MKKSEKAKRKAPARPMASPTPGAGLGRARASFKALAQEKGYFSAQDKAAALDRMESTKIEAKGEEAGDFFEYKIA